MATNRIGEFDFVTLHGSPERLREQILVMARPGVEGVALWKTNQRGIDFTLRSFVDVESFAEADALFEDYLDSIGEDPVGLEWSGVEQAARGFNVCVLEVNRVRQSEVLIDTGGLLASSPGGGKAFLECDWKLIAIKNE